MIRDTSAQDRTVSDTPKRRYTRLAGLTVLALVLVLSAWALGGSWLSVERSVGAERIRSAEVERGLLVRDAAVNGRVVAAVSPTLYAPVASTVTLRIAAGDSVRGGQVLVQLDSPELNAELLREQSTLQSLEVEVSRGRIAADRARLLAQRTADEAELAVTAARRDLERSERGYQMGAIARVDYLRAEDTLASAEIRNRHAARDVELESQAVIFELQTRESALQRQRLVVTELERQIEALAVRSPVDGVIGTLSVVDRAYVSANTPLLTVVDLSQLEVELEVPESYADELGIGMSAEVRIGNQTTSARVSAISPEVVNRQVLARVRFDAEQPAGLRQNQRVSARVLIEERPDVLMVPRGPFLEAHGGHYIYRIRDGIAERSTIRIGATSVSSVEILSGLELGDRVVIAGSDAFQNAERIKIN